MEFGLDQKFLPKHTREILQPLIKKGDIIAMDQETKKKVSHMYLDREDKTIRFTFVEKTGELF